MRETGRWNTRRSGRDQDNGFTIGGCLCSLVVQTFSDFEPHARRYLDRYTAPGLPYAYATYDQQPAHAGPVTAADVLMVNLLSLRFTWREVLPLFTANDDQYTQLRRMLDAALDEARALPQLSDCTTEQASMPALRAVNEHAQKIRPPDSRRNQWGLVAVSKVLHRLSPNIPLVDSRVLAYYATRYAGDVRELMRADLVANRDWMTALAPDYPVRGAPMPLTRMADILIWMSVGDTGPDQQ